MKRRPFVRNITALTLGSLLATRCRFEASSKNKDIGLQLWTVRSEMAADPKGTLEAIAKIGYKDLESAGYSEGLFYGMEKKEFKNLLKELGLKMQSGHTRTGFLAPELKNTMRGNFDAVCEDAAEMGQKTIVCGWFSDEERKDIESYKRLVDLFNKCGVTAKKHGIQFAHHNHDFEFQKMEGLVPYDLLLNETDVDLVKFQMDLYWVKKGGADAFDYFKNHPGRFTTWHVKDMDDTPEKFFTEVGNGIIDFKAIFKEKELSGMEYFYVEQDDCKDHKPMESIAISHDYMSKMRGITYKVSVGG